MRKIISILLLFLIISGIGYFLVIYYFTYSEGTRVGELIRFSKKGVIIKTWEGELSPNISGNHIFKFSVEDGNKNTIYNLQEFQGNFIKVHYIERLKSFFWLGESVYFVTKVEKIKSSHSVINKVEDNHPEEQIHEHQEVTD